MKVKLNPMYEAASGKGGGGVQLPTKYGQIVRSMVIPANPKTARQQAVRQNFTTISQAWSGTLTEAERTGWQTLANGTELPTRFSDGSYSLSAKNLHASLNRTRTELGLGLLTAAPVDGFAVNETGQAIAIAFNSQTTYRISASAAAFGTYALIFASKPLSFGTMKIAPSEFRLLQIMTPATASNVDMKAAYLAKFGVLLGDNSKCQINIVYCNANGFRKAPAGYVVVESD